MTCINLYRLGFYLGWWYMAMIPALGKQKQEGQNVGDQPGLYSQFRSARAIIQDPT